MFKVHDIRETRLYQDGLEEGVKKERQRLISKMAAIGLSAEDIADILGLELDLVCREIAKVHADSVAESKQVNP